ncbi:hypothetical protein, partial [Fischerella sp. FACHB-380]|uniref:hypothetical protein n=1 Tax=Fischerella sp. FACHB-380 TaxID=2692799 RepID=UPI001A7ED8B7
VADGNRSLPLRMIIIFISCIFYSLEVPKTFHTNYKNHKFSVVINTLLIKNTGIKNFSLGNYFGNMYAMLAIGGMKNM